MINKIRENWDQILDIMRIEHDISPVAFNTWIKPLTVYSVEGHTITILVNNELEQMCSYIKKKFEQPLKVTISEYFNDVYDIHITTSEELGKIEATQTVEPEKKPAASIITNKTLNPNYTFDTFVVGKNNELAHATALAVASDPGDYGNPLFIYGGVGLGKTHLMHSIAHYILSYNPDYKIIYTTTETFSNELISAIKNKTQEAFKDKYRNIDMLLIDDIQFIAGKDSTQEEFFHTFNNLYESHKQIVLTSDRPPHEMVRLEDRLRTRFEWGLLADIQPPDYETRMAIIKNKAVHLGFDIPDDVCNYIAENITNNVRQIEGTVKKIRAYHDLDNMELTVPNVSRAIKDMYNKEKAENLPTPSLIIGEVSRFYNIEEAVIRGTLKNKNTAEARQVAMYLCRNLTNMALTDIGAQFEGRNHATVLASIRKIEDMMQASQEFAMVIRDVTYNINSKA